MCLQYIINKNKKNLPHWDWVKIALKIDSPTYPADDRQRPHKPPATETLES